MIIRWAAILLLLASPAWAAQQLRYADFDLVTGLNDGTSEADAWRDCTALTGGVAAGDHVKVQRTATREDHDCTFSTAAGNKDPIILEGYKTTPGDLTTPGDGQDDNWNNVFHTSGQWVLGSGYEIRNFDFEGQPSAAGGYLLGSNGATSWEAHYVRVKNTRTDATVCGVDLDDEGKMFNSYIYAPQGSCGVDIVDAGYLEGSIVDLTATSAVGGVRFDCNGVVRYAYVIDNVIFGTGKAGKGIYCPTFNDTGLGKVAWIEGNSIYNVATCIEFAGLATAGNDRMEVVVNNLCYECTMGVDNNGANTAGATVLFNGMGCTTDYEGFGDQATSIGAVTLTANPWNDPDNLDFRLNNTAGGGADVQGVGLGDPQDGRHMGAVQAVVPAVTGTLVGVTLTGGSINN